jgi:pimeloyl-ACP methyl ester carboxylesterase
MPDPLLKELSVLGTSGYYKLAYAEWGSRKAGRTVICCHGLSRNGRDFDVLAQVLVKQGLRVIAPDLPGRGRSDWLPSAWDYTDSTYTSAMSALIARLDVADVDWVGTSLGGHVGMLLASQPRAPIRRLILNDFGARVSAVGLRRIAAYVGRQWEFESLPDMEAHLRKALAPFGALSDDQWSHLAQVSAVTGEAGRVRFHFDPEISRRFSIPIWLDIVLWPVWDAVDCPVLIMRGEDSDLLTRATVQEMRRRGRAAESGQVTSIELPGCGHAPALMAMDQIDAVTRFLLERDSPALATTALAA